MFGKLREALMAERTKAEDAEVRAIQAESLAGKGSFNPDGTRVLHLETNPLSEAIRERYESEIRLLRRQLEATGQKPAAAGNSAGEVDPSKLHQRLKEQFKEKIGLFREAVYLMTGYKVDMVTTGSEERPRFKVRSVYAERQEDHLMFVWPASKDVRSLDLADTELARLLAKTDSYHYMTKFNSLPAFMASVQLSLFEKSTIA
jgi:mitotic spindle assembly checkpoint protein MAD1